MITDPSWLTEKQDMETAFSIIEKHRQSSTAEMLSILEIIVTKHNSTEETSRQNISLQMSEWLKEIQYAYIQSYGFEHGMAIFVSVLTKILLKNQVLH